MADMRQLMSRLGLTVNEKKTHLVKLPEERFDFLGYTVGRFYGRDGRAYWGTRPSKKAVKRLLREVHDATARRWNTFRPPDLWDCNMTPASGKPGKIHRFHGG